MELTNKAQAIKDFYQEFIYYRTYSRWNYEAGRRENWDETVDRFRDFWLKNFKLPRDVEEDFHKAIALIRAREIMPSMRLLWTAGKAVENDNICAYNCSYIIMNKPRKFAEMLYILMNGCGVGVSVERQFINQLPEVPNDIKEVDRVIVFEDSKYGWADGLNRFIHSLYRGELPQYDVSKIRPRGSILKTFGGRASGAEPLVDLLKFATKIFYNARGRKLNSEEISDIVCKIAEIVVVGGVRRSAIIILANPSDLRMRNYKKGQFWVTNPQRAMANISLVYDEKPKMSLFLDIWKELIDGQTGEPGILNREGFLKTMLEQGRIVEMPKRKDDEIAGVGTNPCLTSETLFIKKFPNGERKIVRLKDLKVGDYVWSKEGWTKVVNISYSGVKRVYRWITNGGEVELTRNHKIVENGEKVKIEEAQAIDLCWRDFNDVQFDGKDFDLQSVVDGLVIGDGTYCKSTGSVYLCIGENDKDYFDSEIKDFIGMKTTKSKTHTDYYIDTTIKQMKTLPNRTIPDKYFYANDKTKCSFLKGLFSANGCVHKKLKRIEIEQTSFRMTKQIQLMLNSLSIRSFIAYKKPIVRDIKGKQCKTKAHYALFITTDRLKFKKLIGFIQKYKQEALEEICKTPAKEWLTKNTRDIFMVEDLGEQDVYDVTVDNSSHTFWSGGHDVSNCGEIILKPNEFCNLTTVILKRDEKHSLNDMMTKVRFATLLGTLQSMLTNFKFIGEEWKRNCEEERLLGVSLTGLADVGYLHIEVLNKLKTVAKTYNAIYAEKLGINKAKAVTCIKPSGTVSQMILGSSGVHPAYAPYYIRRVRVATTDPLCQLLMDLGIPNKPEVGQSEFDCNTRVFEFPIHHEAEIYRCQMSAIRQLEEWKKLKLYYCNHNPSCTIYVKDHEWLAVGDWIYQNWDIVGGLSFLPLDDAVYPLAPYESVDYNTFEKLVKDFPDVRIYDFQKLVEYEKEDYTVGAKKFECEGNSCRI